MRTEPLVIYHKSQPLCRAEKWSFYDKAQNVGGQYITTTIKSPVPITFSIGDYCDYRGERYYMNNLPSVTQQAKPHRYGDGFVYDNVRFDGASFELCRIIMLDITPTTGLYIPKKGTNYTGSSNFQLYCAEARMMVDGMERVYPAVCTLAGKIQANLDRAYPTLGWKIQVDTASTCEVKGRTELRTHTDDKVISFNNTTVADALAEVNNTFKLNFHVKGRTIYIGYTLGAVTGSFANGGGVSGDNDYYYLGYGQGYADKEHPGRGLYEIKKRSDASQQIITRLRAMGSTKNMPFMYYNKRYDLSQDLYPSNLQLPDTFKSPQEKQAGHQRRKTINKSVYEVHGETNDAYLDKYNDISRCKEGLREGVAIWDGGNGLPEIYPTIEKMTYGELRGNDCPDMLDKKESDNFGIVNGHASFYHYDNDERVDEILAVGKVQGSDMTDDANFGNGLLRPDTLEGSGKIDCPCEMNQHITISHQITKVDRGYDLFPPIRLQPKGKYNLSPIAAGMRVELFINTGRHESAGKHVSCTFHYEIILEKVSLKDNEKKEIGCYKSKEIQVSSGTYEKPGGFINLPKIPDLFDDEKEEGKKRDAQIKEIYLESVSDIYATIVFHIDNVHTDVEDDTYITIHVGNPTFGDGVKLMKDKPKVYVWECALEDEKEVNKPFHVIIKDIGISRFVSQFSNGGQAILSMKDGGCLARNFVIGNDVKRVTYTKNGNTYNGWQLELTRATDESLHRYYPNKTDRLQAGDHYVLLGIPMPDAYVQAAEMRLLVAASQYLRDNSRTKYSYEPKIDELFLARNYDKCVSRNAKEQSIYWNLYAGLRLPFFGSPKTDKADEELPLVNIPIESLTIKEGDGIIPTVEIHLREGRSQSTIHQINAKVDALYDGINRENGGTTLSNTNTAIFRTGVKYFLRNDVADTAKEVITFLKGIMANAVSYFQGIVNKGDINNDGNITNTGNIMTNNLTVTGKATFFDLEILKAKAAGGIIIQSAATFKVDDCEETADGYACYQLCEKDGKVLRQMCRNGDQMLCHGGLNMTAASPDPSQGGGTGTPTANHYYWRLVTDAPTQTETRVIGGKERKCLKIVLSKTDFAKGSDKPQVGDELAQVGNRVDADRQCVIINSAYKSLDVGLVAPYWAKYVGVDDFQLENHRETFLARNDNQIVGNLRARSSSGEIRPVPVLLGEWKSGKEYGYYDSVAHDGRQWLCVAVRGTKTTEEPGKGDAWMLLVDKGKNGQDGRTSYFHVKYADVASPTSSSQMNDTSGDYMGTYVDFTQADSDDPRRYTWVRTKGAQGADGTQGVPGKNGADGRTSYLHIKYSNDGGGTFTSNGGEDAGDYIGQYVDFNMRDSGNPRDYKWALVKGKDGRDGRDGVDGRDGRNGENGADGTDGKDGKDGENGKDSVSYALVPLEEKVVAYLTDDKGKLVDVELKYKVRKSVGERVSFVTDLAAEGMTLEVSGGLGDFGADGERFFILESVLYEDNYDSYAVTLTKGGNVVDRRVLPITFKPKVVFDIDAENGEIRRDITNVKGDMNSFKATINETSNTVGNLSKEFTQMKQTSKEISMTVNNGTRPNLLWGSDLNLDGVDTTSKEAIEKRLGVGLSATRVESKEWFEYLKGGGVGGADAIKAKVAAVNGEGNYYAGLYWQIGFGAKSNVKVKPNTKYTFSFWIRTEILQGRGYAVAESFNMESLTGGRKDSTMPWTTVPAKNEWERKSYTFTTGATGYIMVGVGLSGEDNFSGLIYLCHPKLEEGKVATPWCAYDGTVDALLAGGFDIKEKKFTATSDNFVVRNNRGEQTFMVDENGRINNGMLTSRLQLTEPTIITKENYKEFCYKGKRNGYDVLFLDLLKCGTLLVLMNVNEQLYLDLPSFKFFEGYNRYTLVETAKAQYEKMRYIGNTIILYNINSQIVFVSGTLKYKRMAGVHDMSNLDEYGFYTAERLPCRASELACFECKFGITKPEKSQPWFYRKGGVYWEFCRVTIT